MKIRRAQAKDTSTLTAIALRSKQSNGYDTEFMQACREELTVTDRHLHSSEYWLAETDVVCGFAALRFATDAGVADVESFFIDPPFQGQGVGRLLWQKLLERATQQETRMLQLAADPAAVGFYEVLGFRVTGLVPSGSIAGRTLPRMTLSL